MIRGSRVVDLRINRSFFRFKIHRPPYNAFLCYRRSIHWAAFYYRNNGDVSVQQRPLVLDSRINKVGRWSTRLRNIERRKTISRHSTGERRQTSIGQKDNTSIETVRLLSTPGTQSLQYCDVLYNRDSSRDRKCGQITTVSVLMTKCHDDSTLRARNNIVVRAYKRINLTHGVLHHAKLLFHAFLTYVRPLVGLITFL